MKYNKCVILKPDSKLMQSGYSHCGLDYLGLPKLSLVSLC